MRGSQLCATGSTELAAVFFVDEPDDHVAVVADLDDLEVAAAVAELAWFELDLAAGLRKGGQFDGGVAFVAAA